MLPVLVYCLLIFPSTKWPPFSLTIFSNAFPWMKNFVMPIDFHWSLFLRVQMTICDQAINWIKADPIHRRIYAAQGGDKSIGFLGGNFSEIWIQIGYTCIWKFRLQKSSNLSLPSCVDILRLGQNSRHFADDIFICTIINNIFWFSNKISLKNFSVVPFTIWQY